MERRPDRVLRPGGWLGRVTLMRWFAGVVLMLLVGGVGTAHAQYFGQSKVQYKRYSFQVIQTEHFDIYFYEEERTAALDAARMAERAYGRLSRVLRRDFLARKPIILYASTEDFAETNVIPGDLGEGTGGVTEPIKHRMVVPFSGSYAELAHVLQHEMTHQFQFDEISHGQIGGGISTLESINPPLWYMEGMAEYLSLGPIDPYTSMWLRDAALEGHLPSIEQMTVDPRIFPYYFGHAIWAYIGARWGDEVIGEILKSTVRFGVETAFQRVLGRSTAQISEDWREAVQTTVLPHVAEHLPARNVAKAVLTEQRSGGRWHLGPVFSPDGKQLAYLSEGNGFFVDLYIADAQSGRNPRRLIRSTVNSHYESLRWINSAGEFSPDGNYFVLAVQEHQHDDLVILDMKNDREAARLVLPSGGRDHVAHVVPRWKENRVYRLPGRLVGPLHREPGRNGVRTPHRRPVRRFASGMVARRQDDRLLNRSRPGHGSRGAAFRQYARGALPRGHKTGRGPAAHGLRDEYQPRLVSRRPIARLCVGSNRDRQCLPVQFRRQQCVPADGRLDGRRRDRAILAVHLLGAQRGPTGVYLLPE